jgi:hypothetical protein
MAGAHYGEKIVLPGNHPTGAEVRGARFMRLKKRLLPPGPRPSGEKGRAGYGRGPARNRSPEWIQRFILNARLYQPGTTMPKYEIRLEDWKP